MTTQAKKLTIAISAAALFCGIAVFLADYLTVSRPAFGPMVQLLSLIHI